MTELTATVVIESLLRATADDSTPIIRRLARNQARVFLDSRAGDAWWTDAGAVKEARQVFQAGRAALLKEQSRNTHLKGVYEPIIAALEPMLSTLAHLDSRPPAAATPAPAVDAVPAGEVGPTREQLDAWLTEHCGTGLPHGEATDRDTALHGLAYVLRQIESTSSYKVHIGQCNSATSALRWALDFIASAALSHGEGRK